uniref:PLA2c domain-containing protein n=1 Tax=Cyclopterus lumpus TaxID=8103 RepID=A0A8C2ZT58_CYCLU
MCLRGLYNLYTYDIPVPGPHIGSGKTPNKTEKKREQQRRIPLPGWTEAIDNSVPHITLLGSGGGQRAAVGLVGSLYQMEKEGLLDTLLYLGGVSGSAWSMSSLYSDQEWSTNMGRAVSRLSGPGVGLAEALVQLGERAKEEHFSLTDIWGVMTSAGIMKQLDLRHLSGDAMNAFNPYPIYNAVNKNCKWFEMTPHEAGFTDLGFFINTSHLISSHEADRGVKGPEMDMIKLQGVFYDQLSRSVYSSREVSPSSLSSLFHEKQRGEETTWLSKLDGEKQLNKNTNVLYCDLCCWEGAVVPSCIKLNKEHLQLIDAGLMLNMPYPPFLGEKRDADLLIALDYGANGTFQTLTLAREYAVAVNKPFPEINDKILEETDWPKDCYVFEGKKKEPTIVYMPLFNRHNCKAKMEEFSTFQLPFSQEKIEFLLEMAKANIKNNKETLLREIHKAVIRRQLNI